MYWLCFYNGFDKPDIECAFSCSFMVAEYAKKFIDSDSASCYTVFCADSVVTMSLKEFLKNEKEKEISK